MGGGLIFADASAVGKEATAGALTAVSSLLVILYPRVVFPFWSTTDTGLIEEVRETVPLSRKGLSTASGLDLP